MVKPPKFYVYHENIQSNLYEYMKYLIISYQSYIVDDFAHRNAHTKMTELTKIYQMLNPKDKKQFSILSNTNYNYHIHDKNVISTCWKVL